VQATRSLARSEAEVEQLIRQSPKHIIVVTGTAAMRCECGRQHAHVPPSRTRAGPRGVGKSAMMKRLVHNRRFTIRIDCGRTNWEQVQRERTCAQTIMANGSLAQAAAADEASSAAAFIDVRVLNARCM
jgi:hypothetical protein